MAEENIFVNTQVPAELDMKLRRIAAEKRVSRSEIVRLAIEKFLVDYQVISVEDLPGPDDAEHPPVVTIAPKES